MTNLNNGVDIQGMGNTNGLVNLLETYNKGFIEILKLQTNQILVNEPEPKSNMVLVSEISSTKGDTTSKVINVGFEKLKNPLLREKFQNGKKVKFNPKTHIRVKNLGYKSIYVLDSMSKKKWKEYFLKGKVYLDKDVTTSRISQKILFDKSIKKFFGKKDTSK